MADSAKTPHHRPSARILLGMLAAALAAGPALAQDNGARQQGGGPGATIPLKRVVLFNSGVGFFEHGGEVEGDAQVELKFNVGDINDLLKSMVLEDLGGGRISTVTYGSQDPITKTLQTFAIDLTSNPTLADLLGQIRGETIEIEAPNKIVGTIVGIERRKQPVGEETVEAEFLTLLTDEGLRSVPLAGVLRIKLVDESLDAELRQALTVLAMGHSTDKKTVTLKFLGEGDRAVRVGYIQESPIWKTSYRLVLKDNGAAFLQGWAIVENTTEEDWHDVALTLVSGRPISFVMNLYQPLYVPRPLVEPELFASLRPQTYGQDLEENEAELRRHAREGAGEDRRLAETEPLARNYRADHAYFGKQGERIEKMAAGAAIDPSQGVQSVAQAAEVGELFQYAIDEPVDLPRQQSAMLPIVNDSVDGEKLSIYNAAVHQKHPLNGLRFKNTTGLHLMQGPVTVFDGGAYAGDARIEDLQPGTERLLSYALDLDTEVALESNSSPEQLVSVRLAKGVLYSSRKYQRSQKYTIKNSTDDSKQVLVEYPYDSAWQLIAPKEPAEKTRDLYRFAVTAEPGTPAILVVEEEQVVHQEAAVNNLDQAAIQFYLNAKVVSDEVKQALAEVVRRKQQIDQLAARAQLLEQQINVIGQEQARIRENMAQLDRNTELYSRYVKKFGAQEDKVEQLRSQIEQLQEELAQQRQELDNYLLGLGVE